MKLLTLARDLQRRKARERQQRFVAEGVRTVEVLLDAPLAITGLLYTRGLLETARGSALVAKAEAIGVPGAEISDADLASASDTESPQGVVAIAEVPAYELGPPPEPFRLLVLDALQDPGNVGTILRTAAALGASATVALPGTVDLWNAKVVRSSMGAHFTHPVVQWPWETLASYLDRYALPLWAADAGGDSIRSVEVPSQLALVVGNEGAGVTPNVSARATRRVSIPMASGVESLNVAVATGILLHTLSHPLSNTLAPHPSPS